MITNRARWFLLLVLFCASPCLAQELVVSTDKPDGIYQIGETIHWRIEWKGKTPVSSASYSLKKGGLAELSKGTISLADGVGTLEGKLNGPGTILAEITVTTTDGKKTAYGGAVASLDKITTSASRPVDFDAFWDGKIKEVAAIPANAKLESGTSDKPTVDYWKITMDNIRGSHIQGQLARPKQGEKFPALLIVQWAGVYPLSKSWVMDRAVEGWLVLNINAHDLPIDQPPGFYLEKAGGALKDYPAIGNEDRETSYFLRMYLSCYQAAEYLAHRADWDGKTLVVQGGSQGGLQALVTAAIHPKITAALASVPAGCDMLGPDVGRAPGWPMWYWKIEGKDAARVREASRYYDVVNFMKRIKCPVLVGIGLIDQVCPPAGILAALNLLASPKEIIILPNGDHQGSYDSHAAYNKRCWGSWLPELRQGRAAPVLR